MLAEYCAQCRQQPRIDLCQVPQRRRTYVRARKALARPGNGVELREPVHRPSSLGGHFSPAHRTVPRPMRGMKNANIGGKTPMERLIRPLNRSVLTARESTRL